MKGRRAQKLHNLHKLYGPVIRLGPNEVSAGSYKDYRPIYNDAKSITKDPSFYSVATFVGKGNLFQMTNSAEHSSRRRMSAAPYSLQSINSLNVLIRERAENLVKNLVDRASESTSGTVDAFELCGLYSLEVICQAAFATDISAESQNVRGLKLLDAMDGSAKTFIFTALMPWLRSAGCGMMLPGHIGECYRKGAYWELELRRMLDHLLKATAEGQSTENNFLAPLLDRQDSFLGRKLTKEELIEEAMGIMFAGSGTTSTTLTYLLYALACEENAEIQTKLRQEVKKLPPNDMLTLRACPYVNSVIKEVFRLFPTIISTLPRVLGSQFQLGGYVLPAGTVVGMQNYVHHRDSAVFDAPDMFNPERWLNSTKEMELSLTPFSVGKRNCIGQNLAWEELYLAVDAIMRSDITLKLGKEMKSWEMDMEDRFNIAPKGRRLMLEIKKGTSETSN
ncbi:cytochrome P450 [Penicillium sp. IBT 18751x]|nr:cytochrome P450 [Penicillium sp. IBT 18751x]